METIISNIQSAVSDPDTLSEQLMKALSLIDAKLASYYTQLDAAITEENSTEKNTIRAEQFMRRRAIKDAYHHMDVSIIDRSEILSTRDMIHDIITSAAVFDADDKEAASEFIRQLADLPEIYADLRETYGYIDRQIKDIEAHTSSIIKNAVELHYGVNTGQIKHTITEKSISKFIVAQKDMLLSE